MKTIFKSGFILTMILALIVPFITAEAQVSWEGSQAYTVLAADSVIADAGTKTSIVQTLFTLGNLGGSSGNEANGAAVFTKGAKILVMAKQANDSVRAYVYLRVGSITNGTAQTTYATIFIDSLYNGTAGTAGSQVLIDLSSYVTMRHVQVEVRGQSFGNPSTGANIPTFSAIFGGIGEYVKPRNLQ